MRGRPITTMAVLTVAVALTTSACLGSSTTNNSGSGGNATGGTAAGSTRTRASSRWMRSNHSKVAGSVELLSRISTSKSGQVLRVRMLRRQASSRSALSLVGMMIEARQRAGRRKRGW